MPVHVRLRFLFVVRPSLARAPLFVDAGAAIVDTLGFLGAKRGCIVWIRLWVERKV